MPMIKREEILTINQKGWNKVAPLFYGGTALPKYGPLAETEDELKENYHALRLSTIRR